MPVSDKNVQKLDMIAGRLKKGLPECPIHILEVVDIWKGRGWGVQIERQRTETTTRIGDEASDARD